MNRVDEIKSRSSKVQGTPWKAGRYSTDYYKQGYTIDTEQGGVVAECMENENHVSFIANAPSDIEYLISKLEIAQRALNQIAFDTVQPAIEEEALQALKQIRE